MGRVVICYPGNSIQLRLHFTLSGKEVKECKRKIFSEITNASVLPELVFFGSPKHIGSVTF